MCVRDMRWHTAFFCRSAEFKFRIDFENLISCLLLVRINVRISNIIKKSVHFLYAVFAVLEHEVEDSVVFEKKVNCVLLDFLIFCSINVVVNLAEGNINNIDDALKINPYCIDVSSGVEENGFKDFDKMKELIKRCKDYE